MIYTDRQLLREQSNFRTFIFDDYNSHFRLQGINCPHMRQYGEKLLHVSNSEHRQLVFKLPIALYVPEVTLFYLTSPLILLSSYWLCIVEYLIIMFHTFEI